MTWPKAVSRMLAAAVALGLARIALWIPGTATSVAILRRIGYPRPWAAVLPFGRGYAVVDAALEGRGHMYAFGLRVPALPAKLHEPLSLVLARVPFAGWVLAPAFRVGCGGPCYAWAYAWLSGKDLKDTQLAGGLSAFSGTLASILMIYHWLKYRPVRP